MAGAPPVGKTKQQHPSSPANSPCASSRSGSAGRWGNGLADSDVLDVLPDMARLARETAGGSWAAANAVTFQDCFTVAKIGALSAAETYARSRGARFRTWAIHKANFALRDMKRNEGWPRRPRSQRKRGAPRGPDRWRFVHLDDRQAPDIPSPGATPEESAIQREERTALHQAISLLGARDQQVLIAYFWEERTLEQIGRRMGVSAQRVSQLLTQAKHRLHEALTARLDCRDADQNSVATCRAR
jgi:RNA polymerase sigma factor (sigma-70 family)